MTHRTRTFASLLAAAALAAPLAADAATPKKGHFAKRDQAKGLSMDTTRHTITKLWFFCRNPKYAGRTFRPELREARYELPQPLRIRRGGRFSYRGTAKRYGPEGQPLGRWKMRFTGRFTSSTRVSITRTLKGCDGTRTVTARRQSG